MSNDGNSSSGFPSLTALLGLLAVAGYQHRDQISDWFRNNMGGGQDASQPGVGQANAAPGQQQGSGGLLGGLGGLLGAGGAGAILNSGLGELVDRFNQSGQGDKANSWVGSGPNQDVAPGDLLAVLSAGAYCMSMASNYNTRNRAAEVLVSGDSSTLIRRRETIEDQLRSELAGD